MDGTRGGRGPGPKESVIETTQGTFSPEFQGEHFIRVLTLDENFLSNAACFGNSSAQGYESEGPADSAWPVPIYQRTFTSFAKFMSGATPPQC